ncbi:MAG: metallophosphoesterase [Bacilli bacterium]|nr:metallophosphoesterase [Bacilli bacterium]
MKLKIVSLPLISLLIFSSLFSCNKQEKYNKTKIAVFADNQLSTNSGGGTAYAEGFLKNHLRFCKENNVEVIVINGDLVNNAVNQYYVIYENALKEIYGSDDTLYPEFVYAMGNHEWYTDTSSELTDPKAISLFKKHARIDTKNLKRKSVAEVADQSADKISANFYKVINGIPFISVSGSGPNGLLSYTERDEIKSWLKEISNLPRVKNGCPIYVSYHYAIENLTYSFGQGSSSYSTTLDELLKDYPQVVLFSGDTHFAGANERTINQVNYTNINLGSSSYTRHVSRSACMDTYDEYYNLDSGHAGKDTMVGEVAEGYNKTPHIHLVEVDEEGNATYQRYFTNPTRQLGLTWNIPNKVNKEQFKYTNARFKDKTWANLMYNKDGLTWADDKQATYSKTSDKLIVKFDDVIDFNYCEHYQVTVTNDTSKIYNFISHYYKWESNPHTYNYEIRLSDLPDGNIKSITVIAFDFFDNPSLNSLSI